MKAPTLLAVARHRETDSSNPFPSSEESGELRICGDRRRHPPSTETEVKTILPNRELPGGLLAFRNPRGWNETPLWLPEHLTVVFADALTERAGVLRVWMSPTHEYQVRRSVDAAQRWFRARGASGRLCAESSHGANNRGHLALS
jgi:hypothetical protein